MRQHEAWETIISPVVNALGFIWVGLQTASQGKRTILKLYVDKREGVSCEDCARISKQVSMVLSVEDVVKGDYLLEVSSPGLDRLLFTLAQCREYVGERVAIRLGVPIAGKRNFKGKLHVEGEQISVQLDNDGLVTFPFIDIDEARLVPEW
jgi:ribosome maturation factor RimP